MSHITQQVFDAVVTAITGLSTTGTNVFANQPEERALQGTELPALVPLLLGEDAQAITLDGALLQRLLRIGIDIKVKGTGDIDDTVNDIRTQVEDALAGAFTVSGKTIYLDYNGLEDPVLDGSYDQPMISARMNFSCVLFNDVSSASALTNG